VADAEARGVRRSFPSGGTRSGLPGWSCSACSSPAPCGRCQREKGWSGAWPAGASRRDRGRHLRPLLGGNHRASGRSGHSQRVDAYRPGLPRPSTAYGTRPLALGCFSGGPAARSRHLPHSTGSNRSCCPSRRSESTPRRYLPSSATKTERSRPSEATQPRKGRVADRQPPRDERRATLRSLSVPASNFGMVEKAFASNVDAVLFDLEDAVAPSDTFSYSANS
jgi:hypothetical protein